MKLTFNIDYRTNWGESLYITGDVAELGENDYHKALKMTLGDGSQWSIDIEVPDECASINYRYQVRHENGHCKNEWGPAHHFSRGRNARVYQVFDRWQDQPWDKPCYASAFTECICKRPDPAKEILPRIGHVTFKIAAPMLQPEWRLAVCGGATVLGNWDPAKATVLSDFGYPEWTATVEARGLAADTEYKFVIIDKDGNVVAWEGGDNRRLGVDPKSDVSTIVAGMRFFNPLAPWRGAGTAIPVFSLRSDDDFGVGDFFDLKKMVDWCKETGQSFLQILPINDTTMTHTWVDSYPYKAISCFALHPMYLRLEELGTLADTERRNYYEAQRAELNALPQVDYERVNNVKNEYFREIFAQDGKRILSSHEYKAFVDANASWLEPYAAFCVLRDLNGTPVFSRWGEFAEYDKAKVDAFIAEHRDEIDFVMYLQFNLAKQLTEVHEYARAAGVAIKGDIPIGISRDSVDAWIYPRLFNMDCQAGAPPDDFSVMGQNWGFPTYNWEEMARDGFEWWKDRFRNMAQYFDAYRVDHILGFFRIWQIPINAVHGLLGIFYPALPFSVDELRYNYDFWLDIDLQTTPYIYDWMLHDFFGDYAEEARERFMYEIGGGRLKLKDPFATQRAVEDFFANEPKDEKNSRLCDGLLGLIDQVLFVPDPYEPGKFHPRISAQFTYTYRALNDYERWCFDRLYNDFFYRRHNDFWYGKAMWKLPPLIEATSMLTCAEDLGMIPGCVPAVLSNLQILTLEIQRMPKDPTTPFGNTWSYPYNSVCTTSTHDMGGIRVWWEEDRSKSSQFFHDVLHEGSDAPYFAEPWVCEKILDLQVKSPSMLCILPLADWLSMDGKLRRDNPADEVINVPANPRHYWRYRMHLSLDELRDAKEFNEKLTKKIKDSGR